MKIHNNIPPLDPSLILPMKTFLIEQRWREAAIINSILDVGNTGSSDIRDGLLLCGPLNDQQKACVYLTGKDIVSWAKAGDFLSAIQGFQVTNGCLTFPLGIVDIVTYPFWFALVYGVEIHATDTLMQINENLIVPYVNSLGCCASLLTIQHFNEQPLDDAPVHNLICYEMTSMISTVQKLSHDCISEGNARQVALGWMSQDATELLRIAVNPICVCGKQPIMDDRYVFMERRDGDGQKKDLPDLKW